MIYTSPLTDLSFLKKISFLLGLFLPLTLSAQLTQDLLNTTVFIEAFDFSGQKLGMGTGVLLAKGKVLANYHLIAGAAKIKVTSNETQTVFDANGYFAEDEETDMIVLSVPGLAGLAAQFSPGNLNFDSAKVRFIENPLAKKVEFKYGVFTRMRTVGEYSLMEVSSTQAEECTNGPIWYGGMIYGMVVAGFLEEKYTLYAVPIENLLPKLRFSTVIKSLESLRGKTYLGKSKMQSALLESINAIIWRPFEQAVALAQKKQKKVLLNIGANWCGWCQLMEEKTYSQRKIIRYINENYYASRLDGEGHDTIYYAGQPFAYDQKVRSHRLAWLLLDGNMSYPATVFLDSEINLLTVVPGFVEKGKMDVILHFFNENAYMNNQISFEKYEENYRITNGSD